MVIQDLYDKILLETGQFLYNAIPTQVQAEAVEKDDGNLDAGTYYYKVTAVDSYGESLASQFCSVTIESGDSENAVKVWWKNVPGAISYKIYGRTTDYNYYWTSSKNWFLDENKTTISPEAGTPPLTQTCKIGLEIDLNDFQTIVNGVLAEHGRTHLRTAAQYITVQAVSNIPQYQWTINIPDIILHVEYDKVLPPYLQRVSEWVVPEVPHDEWRYDATTGILYLPAAGYFWVTKGYVKTVEEIELKNKSFFKMLRRDFLYALARARRSMRLTEIPIEYDAETLASEAERIDEDLKESETAKWWQILGGKGLSS